MSNSREQLLARVKQNQPSTTPLPNLGVLGSYDFEILEKYKETLKGIGGNAIEVNSEEEVIAYIKEHYPADSRIITTLPAFESLAEPNWQNLDPHDLESVDLTIIKAHFGVAENSALWVTEELLGQRVAPFITQYLIMLVNASDILPTMHQAYDRIAQSEYGYGAFIAGPSKTADIEQSLVIGAHGPRGLNVFIIK